MKVFFKKMMAFLSGSSEKDNNGKPSSQTRPRTRWDHDLEPDDAGERFQYQSICPELNAPYSRYHQL